MSDNKFNIYVKPSDSDAKESLLAFINAVQSKNFQSLSNASEYCEVEHHLDVELSSSELDGVFNLKFWAVGSLTVEDFLAFLIEELNVSAVEAAVFIGDCGEYDFHFMSSEDDESFDEYDDHEWSWLENPVIEWEDQNIVLTGKFENYESRDELAEELEDLGANIRSSISKKTTLLVTGLRVGPSKLEKAKSLGVRIITENELMESMELC
ncbi:BRCT domain-containing protein [Shewanella woodyi]|uniref:BRCT domain protein n=1 Tax=Shewanella woodyi (strain ATCC 51908 / MS32) TaxID=392500 RepID=B1KR26_SHEWM|nr:BRCT domain-containing protein [Shewanella woodyi]ACA84843.1 BRCT domain protein [Shewanella woodyi ATCC 51908]